MLDINKIEHGVYVVYLGLNPRMSSDHRAGLDAFSKKFIVGKLYRICFIRGSYAVYSDEGQPYIISYAGVIDNRLLFRHPNKLMDSLLSE